MRDITITPTSILVVNGSNGWAIDRTTGVIAPQTTYISIIDCDSGLAVSCSNYARYYRKIPSNLRARWVEAMIKWHNVQLDIYENWEVWLTWLEYIDPADFHHGVMTYNSLGNYLFQNPTIGDIVSMMIEEGCLPNSTTISGIKEWVALMRREQIRCLFSYGSKDLHLYFSEKFRHHDDFASVRNIWHDFCKVMERRAKEKDVSCVEGKEFVSH